MSNAIIILILILFIAVGIKETIKHLKGEGSCCGGSSPKIKKKKLSNPIIHRFILNIDGMHCKHCVSTVTEIINDFDGATGRVSLGKGQATVLCDREVDIEKIKEKIRVRGYDVK